MKKSFLITLAAVSSVALIGCSSSSDDNGGKEETKKPTITITKNEKVLVDVAKKEATNYVVNKIEFTTENASEEQVNGLLANVNPTCDNDVKKEDLKYAPVEGGFLVGITADKVADSKSVTCEFNVDGFVVNGDKKVVYDDKNFTDASSVVVTKDAAKVDAIIAKVGDKSVDYTVKVHGPSSFALESDILKETLGEAKTVSNFEATIPTEFQKVVTGCAKAELQAATGCKLAVDGSKADAAIPAANITFAGDPTNTNYGQISVEVQAAGEPSPEEPQPGQPTAIEVKPVADAHVGSTLDQITYLGVIENAAITAETKLYCADKTTADAKLTACNTDKIVSQKAEAGKLYFAAKTFGGKQSVALVNAEGTLLEGTLPSAQLSDTAPVLQQFVHATFQSAAAANADATDANTAVTNNKVVLGAKQNIAFVLLEMKAPKGEVFTYNSSKAALTREKATVTGIQVEGANGGADSLKVELNKGSLANVGNAAIGNTAECKNNQDSQKCIIKVTVPNELTTWDTNTTLPIKVKSEKAIILGANSAQ